jgi:hypothetical protein
MKFRGVGRVIFFDCVAVSFTLHRVLEVFGQSNGIGSMCVLRNVDSHLNFSVLSISG